jgi:hypothetical protein
LDEPRCRAIEARRLVAVNLDLAIVDPHTRERREDMFDKRHVMRRITNRGSSIRARDELPPRGNARLIFHVHAAKVQPAPGRGGNESNGSGAARPEAHAAYLDGSLDGPLMAIAKLLHRHSLS